MIFLQTIITGGFAVLTSFVTWKLAVKRERKKAKHEILIKRYDEQVVLYTAVIASFDKLIRIHQVGGDFDALSNEISLLGAKVNLIGDPQVNKKLAIVSHDIDDWKELCGKSRHHSKDIFSFFTNDQINFKEQADKVYPKMRKSINEFYIVVQNYLTKLREEIDKSTN